MKKTFILLGIELLANLVYSNVYFPKPKEGHFRAAVYEHDLIVPEDCLNNVCLREVALGYIELNLQILEEQVVKAARNGTQIILLPEDGIHGYRHLNRQTLRCSRLHFFFSFYYLKIGPFLNMFQLQQMVQFLVLKKSMRTLTSQEGF